MDALVSARSAMRAAHRADEAGIVRDLIAGASLDDATRERAVARAAALVKAIRADKRPGLMEVFLAEYGLSTEEGVALMCLAEALLRVPDADTIDELIEDKIAPSQWGRHLGHSNSSLVNASTWALMLTGKVLDADRSRGVAGVLRGAVKRLGEPVIRTAVRQAMKELGSQFVLGETIQAAMQRGAAMEAKGYSYSYDMLGEAALTGDDAKAYFDAYAAAIKAIAARCRFDDIRCNPGISVKLSALHPRYEVAQHDRVMAELVPRVAELAAMAAEARMGFNIDAEEADRLDLSLDVIEAVLADPRLAGWDGFGVVVQAYGKRAAPVIDWLHALAEKHDRRIMVRLVKGAYWDTEIKRAQIDGVEDFPVFTRKTASDVSYIACAKKLLGLTDRIYPQFATHNAHSVASILEMADNRDTFEFQRLHGMGEALHRLVLEGEGTRCRIYAPVGAHRDLLAYLVRRLLENGANSSFVNQIVDTSVPVGDIVADPVSEWEAEPGANPRIRKPAEVFLPLRGNSKGFDLRSRDDLERIEAARSPLRAEAFEAAPMLAGGRGKGKARPVVNPADPSDIVGTVVEASPQDVRTALDAAQDWADCPTEERARILRHAADLYEENFGPIFAILAREAGKTQLDAVGELREAADFLRYYAGEAERAGETRPRGRFACISPWNFPLAIFTGQFAAALAAGNGVLAKPAEQTPLIAALAVRLMHEAGVPRNVLQLLPGDGATVGAALTSDPRIDGVCFTGSTETAQAINQAMAQTLAPDAPLIAETGGLNAMIVDSTALPEQAVRDIVSSAFQSAGQRCSALRVLYVQEDVADGILEMLSGAMDALRAGNPWDLATDIGPVIDEDARRTIADHVEKARAQNRLIKELDVPGEGTFVAPTVIRVKGIGDLEREIFGPVLHVATFKASKIGRVVADINASGYGLTFGLHSRIDDRVEQITSRIRVGNVYINRNQIGAVVASQPFGGEGLSGTGPKAGGPHYLSRFMRAETRSGTPQEAIGADLTAVQARLDPLRFARAAVQATTAMPGVTGESNRLSAFGRGVVLCLGPDAAQADEQARLARAAGCAPLIVAPEASGSDAIPFFLERDALATLEGFDAVMLWSDEADLRAARVALARRQGPIIPLIMEADPADRLILERHVCIDTTAAGGNAALLAANA
ncbi:bifunctional proline dehydrogenase/L-glutamate gamma-semialdehyde dehydrogenase PutA [Oricola sp.]|uniref:bifunctional proline dehydrogenase/L-glutamate gamma-semialdehyde dehydrogenase PutA n=1 Tax=Oricola sp. TaxID=1979950 RepID=UPI0025D9FF2A|nr:bifunctional proline dehydrogenase/L-glutamate gamma-semialdehyde dehydrogenase PutA [Oricola sp.]MCI5078333.1 bifunctional proline dehydrogenase/L-glutamate gamma-semialdehyde dehydrogenase PutA [Oricola sp.]